MDKFIIKGKQKLSGKIKVSGAKNSALKIIAATILLKDPVTISNVPNLMDVRTMKKVLEKLGAKVEFCPESSTMKIDPSSINSYRAPYDLVKTMRASFQVMGPLLARFGNAEISLPGGCNFGPRPVDFHLKAFEQMGATITTEHGYICAKVDKLIGNHIYFDFPSVGATENVIMAATLTDGVTIIENAAKEPEVVDLVSFLKLCGAKIEGEGTGRIRIEGVKELQARDFTVLADRIEAGTFILASLVTNSSLEVVGAPVAALEVFLEKLKACGHDFEIHQNSLIVKPNQNPKAIKFTARPHPGFPTDLQAPMTAYLATVNGTSLVTEGVYENRFVYISELNRMGASIELDGNKAYISGQKGLSGAPVMASDLRAGAALVIAALGAEGITEINRVYHIDRGYDGLVDKLTAVGANIERISG
ncbi:UDP-N-acetylglucosamine 1-carboxyvinyltransferase [bacterium]|nr:UDP-N-acetylglucosamine 1-carboxyvinyltransferase [bacterium]